MSLGNKRNVLTNLGSEIDRPIVRLQFFCNRTFEVLVVDQLRGIDVKLHCVLEIGIRVIAINETAITGDSRERKPSVLNKVAKGFEKAVRERIVVLF